MLADPTRCARRSAIKAACLVSVSDLAAAAGISDATVSQTLRHLRASGTVTTERDGRIIRYQPHDHVIGELLDQGHPARRRHSPGQGLVAVRPGTPMA